MALFGQSGPKVVHTDDDTESLLDEAGMSFLLLTADDLNKALIESGVADISARRTICENTLFSLAYRFDAGWLVEGRNKLFTKLCFAERGPVGPDSNLGALHTLHVATGAVSMHESVMGVVAQYFEDYEEGRNIDPPLRHGSYDIEN